jgi:hypothetical protein
LFSMNNLTGLIPILYMALQIVSRELIGFIPAASRNSTADAAGLNQVIRVPVTPETENQDITPGTPPTNGGTDFGYVDMAITKNKIAKPIIWTGDDQISVGSQLNQMMINQYTQAMRSLVNEVERDVCREGAIGALSAGNVYGTAGQTPFASDLSDLAQIKKLQDDLGTPLGDRHLIINTATGAALRALHQLTNVSDAGETDMLRRGVLNNLMGYSIRESSGFLSIDPGARTAVVLSAAAPKGATSIAVATATGALNIGAIIMLAGNYYTLTAPAAGGATALNITPGLQKDIASGVAGTVLSAYMPNVAFSRDFIYLATRNPAMPQQANRSGGTLLDMISVTDPVSGLSFQICLFDAYRQVRIEIGLAWGTRVINRKHGLLVLG